MRKSRANRTNLAPRQKQRPLQLAKCKRRTLERVCSNRTRVFTRTCKRRKQEGFVDRSYRRDNSARRRQRLVYMQQTGHAAAGSTAPVSQTESPASQTAAQSQPQQNFGSASASTSDKPYSTPSQAITPASNKQRHRFHRRWTYRRFRLARFREICARLLSVARFEPVAEPVEPPKKSAFTSCVLLLQP